ncbi:MAG TPA: mechanosensitive ion channel, partial [Nitrospirae bacterium]|nr:mechanosensitive ion channel [Nitrospirota bacterium]
MKRFIPGYLNSADSPVLTALLVFVLYIILAKLADIFIDKVVRRLAKFSRTELDDKIIDVTHRPVFFTVLIVGSIHAVKLLNPSESMVFYSVGILNSLLVLIWGICVVRISNLIIKNHVHRIADLTGLGREITPLAENVWKVIVFVAALMIILSIWKINITPLLASAGIVGVAVALAAKDTLANFFGGISIF